MFIFEGKPDETTCQLLKAHGFKWSPSRDGKPWVRHLNNAGLWHAKMVREKLDTDQAAPQGSRGTSTVKLRASSPVKRSEPVPAEGHRLDG